MVTLPPTPELVRPTGPRHHVSFSELSTFRDCPMKWMLQYYWRLKSPIRSDALSMGTVWHGGMDIHYAGIAYGVGKHETMAHVYNYFGDAAEAHGISDDILDRLRWMYADYVRVYGSDTAYRILRSEAEFEFPMPVDGAPELIIVGRIDLETEDAETGVRRVWDHKSASSRDLSAKAWQDESLMEDQFVLYAAAKRRLGDPAASVVYNGARTDRLKRDMTDAERFARIHMTYPEAAQDAVWADAENAAAALVRFWNDPDSIYSVPNPRQCFPAGTMVRPVGGLQRVTRRWYKGQTATVRTAGGQEVTGTAKHPVLTDKGWVALGELRRGDRVVRDYRVDDPASADDQHGYTEVSELFRASEGVLQVATPGGHLHGEDLGQQEVHVVTVDRRLPPVANAAGIEPAGHQVLIGANGRFVDAGLPPAGGLDQGLLVGAGVGRKPEHAKLGLPSGGPLAGHQPAGLGSIAGPGAPREQVLVDRASAHAEAYRGGLDGLPVMEPTDEVVDVVIADFVGHVYNLQTTSGSYLASSLLALNCGWKCDFQKVHIEARATGRPITDIAVGYGFRQSGVQGHDDLPTGDPVDLAAASW